MGITNPFFFGGFPCFFLLEKQGKEGQGLSMYPKSLFGLFLTFRVISILQGYFWRPSRNTL